QDPCVVVVGEPFPPGDSKRDDARDEDVRQRRQPQPPAPADAPGKRRRGAGRAALPPEVPRHVGPALPSLDLDTRPIRLNGVRHGRYPNPWLWSHRSAAAAAPAPSDPTWSSSSESVVELSSAETASMTRARAGPYR